MNQKNLDKYYEAKIASKNAGMIVDLKKLIAKAEATLKELQSETRDPIEDLECERNAEERYCEILSTSWLRNFSPATPFGNH